MNGSKIFLDLDIAKIICKCSSVLVVSITVILFCLGLQIVTSPICNVLVLSHVTTIYSQCSTAAFPSLTTSKNIESISRSVCAYKALHEEQPVYLHSLLATSLPSRSRRSNKGITLSVPRIKTNASARAFRPWGPFSLEQPSIICPFSHLSCYLQETSQNKSFLILAFSPVDTSAPDGPVWCLQNSFHRLHFWALIWLFMPTEPGYARDIGAIENLIDWSISVIILMCSIKRTIPWVDIRQYKNLMLADPSLRSIFLKCTT